MVVSDPRSNPTPKHLDQWWWTWSTFFLCARANFQTSEPSAGRKPSANNESHVFSTKLYIKLL